MRNVIDEILEKKKRNIPIRDWLQPSRPRWDLVSNRISRISAIPDIINILNLVYHQSFFGDIDDPELKQEICGIEFPEVPNEISRYIPIGLVACIEAYFRQVYADLINHGDPYKQNATAFSDIKFNIQMAISLERAELSIGDFISHLLPINGFEGIESTITKLTGANFSEELKKEIDNSNRFSQAELFSEAELMMDDEEECIRKGYEVTSEGFIKPTPQKIYRDMVCDIKDIFELRHRLCHEASSFMPNSDNLIILNAPSVVLNFLVISEAVVERMLSYSADCTASN